MLNKLKSVLAREQRGSARAFSLTALRLAPWIVFGPITGVMSEAALSAFRRGRPALGCLCILLNVSILVSVPALTTAILAYSAAHGA
jgi:hypothetical protein